MTSAIEGRTFCGKHGTSFLLLGLLQPQQPHHYKENTVFISLNRSCSSLSRVKEVGGAVVANFPGELGRLAALSNLRLLEQQLRAH